MLPVGDHDILIGSPVEVRLSDDGNALLWYRRTFHTVQR